MVDFQSQAIDLSQLDLVQEGTVDAINPEADFNDSPPPVPDPEAGDAWLVVPKLVNFKNTDSPLKTQNDPNGNGVHLMLQVAWVLSDTRLEGSLWEGNEIRSWPSTRPGYSGTTEVDTLLRVYTGKAGVGMSRSEKIKTILPFLQAGEAIGLETEWRAEIAAPTERNAEATKVIRRGMRNFPVVEGTEKSPDGPMYKHIFSDPRYPGVEIRTKAAVKAYKSLK